MKKTPKRMCISCREMFEKRSLRRVVRTPEGQVCYDPTGKKPGKGAYLCTTPDCFKKLKKSKLLEKNLKAEIPSSLYEELEATFENEE